MSGEFHFIACYSLDIFLPRGPGFAAITKYRACQVLYKRILFVFVSRKIFVLFLYSSEFCQEYLQHQKIIMYTPNMWMNLLLIIIFIRNKILLGIFHKCLGVFNFYVYLYPASNRNASKFSSSQPR